MSSLLFLSANAADKDSYFIEAKYSYVDGKANSYLDTASDTTAFASVNAGMKLTDTPVRLYIGYDPMRWEDAQADTYSFNVDYVAPIAESKELSYYAGGGIGLMRIKADDISDTGNGAVASIRAGLTYKFYESLYLTGGVKYIYTNDLKIEENRYLFMQMEDMFGGEIGLGLTF